MKIRKNENKRQDNLFWNFTFLFAKWANKNGKKAIVILKIILNKFSPVIIPII